MTAHSLQVIAGRQTFHIWEPIRRGACRSARRREGSWKRVREPRMLDRKSILRRGGELELECPDLGSDLMGNNGESKLSYYKLYYKHPPYQM